MPDEPSPSLPISLLLRIFTIKNSLLIPLPRRLRTRTPGNTPLIPAPLAQPLLRRKLQFPIQLLARHLAMYEITKATSDTSIGFM